MCNHNLGHGQPTQTGDSCRSGRWEFVERLTVVLAGQSRQSQSSMFGDRSKLVSGCRSIGLDSTLELLVHCEVRMVASTLTCTVLPIENPTVLTVDIVEGLARPVT